VADPFGDPHVVTYRLQRVDSHRWRERWRLTGVALRQTERRLAELGVSSMLFFVAIWSEPVAHGLVGESGLRSPYMVVPAKYNLGRWAGPQPTGHGTPEAYELYGRWVYQGVAELNGWPRLVAAAVEELPLHRSPPAGTDWSAARTWDLRRITAKYVPEAFRPGPAARRQAAGPLRATTGVMGRATTVLVRRRRGAQTLRLVVARLDHAPSLYPLRLRVSVPSAGGGTSLETELFRGPHPREQIELAIPEDVQPGAALDVVLEAQRAVHGRRGPRSEALRIESITQHG
jgi:hypothetical protein